MDVTVWLKVTALIGTLDTPVAAAAAPAAVPTAFDEFIQLRP
jgi:hypothetical protein